MGDKDIDANKILSDTYGIQFELLPRLASDICTNGLDNLLCRLSIVKRLSESNRAYCFHKNGPIGTFNADVGNNCLTCRGLMIPWNPFDIGSGNYL